MMDNELLNISDVIGYVRAKDKLDNVAEHIFDMLVDNDYFTDADDPVYATFDVTEKEMIVYYSKNGYEQDVICDCVNVPLECLETEKMLEDYINSKIKMKNCIKDMFYENIESVMKPKSDEWIDKILEE